MSDQGYEKLATNKTALQKNRTGIDEVTSPVVNNFADLKAEMSAMMSNLRLNF